MYFITIKMCTYTPSPMVYSNKNLTKYVTVISIFISPEFTLTETKNVV